ncbi:sodium-coupled monocarboxylate transporter 2 [Drosophila guanche]|uniref:Blast:Sodium-coupled monocarboxylate transporter 2 n=1 Tax=Drosophila guanche TaxID=7266 RepID=A0A3B0K994_DROGU|nr:sodium-coupled monocarboxylate transporter 2 [Drosophila guanche]SPP82649.1 blast:Sodium-coupled monocarboxylate transporter 2 [Drosophila guanche]
MAASTSALASTVATVAAATAENLRFSLTDYIVFTLMLSASAGIGVYFGFFSKAKNTTEEYLQGGKKMPTWPVAISLVSSQLSGVAMMSIPAESYTFGFNIVFIVMAMILTVPVLIYIIVPVFYENNVSNCYQYLEMRFNKLTRQLVTITFIMNQFLMLPVYMFVPSLAFSQVTGINIHLINTVVSSVCVFYTMLGGIKAVVWTDVVQAGVMLLSVVLVAILGTSHTGGLSNVLENASEGGRLDFNFGMDPRLRVTFWSGIFSGLLMWTGKVGLDQSCVQRIVSLPSYAHAKKSLIIAGIGFLFIMTFTCFIGIIMFAYYFGCDPIQAGLVSKPDKLMPFFIQDIMGHLIGMPGVFISCVFSASLSSLSASLNSFAGVVYFDYIKPHIRHTDARANGIMKLVIIVMGAYCILGGYMVQNFNSIIQTMWTITGINTGAVVGVFLLGMFVPRCSAKVAVTGIVFSVVGMLWIIINAQFNFKAGLIRYDVLPNGLDQCEARDFQVILSSINNNITRVLTTPAPFPDAPQQVTTAFGSNRDFSIYDISFYWYKVLGAILVFAWAVPMSYVWPTDKQEKQNPKLYSPFVRNMLNVPDPVVEMEEMPLKSSDSKAKENGIHQDA